MRLLLFLPFALSLIAGVWLWRRHAQRTSLRRATICALPLLACCLLGGFVFRILTTPSWSYNGTRLVPSYRLARGYRLYNLPGEGQLLSNIYGPVTAAVYLPATVMSSPNGAVLVGACITVLLCLAALVWVHFGLGCRRDSLFRALAFLVCGLFVLYLPPLNYSCINVHADGPALAFGAAACACLYRRSGPRGQAALALSALLAVLSPFAKQVFIVLPCALALYLLLADGRRVSLRYCLWLAVCGTLVTMTAVLLFGPRELMFNLITIPAGHSRHTTHSPEALLQALRKIVDFSLCIAFPPVAYLVYCWVGRPLKFPTMRIWLRRNTWTMFAFVALALLPVSILAKVKAGGDFNSFSFALFFLCIANTTMLAQLASSGDCDGRLRRVALAFLLAMALPLALLEGSLAMAIPAAAGILPETEQHIVYEYIKRHPGEGYFPWFPLSHLLAEGTFYHSTYGATDQLLAGVPVSEEQFRAFIPKSLRFAAFGKDGWRVSQGHDYMNFLPKLRGHLSIAELPGWEIYGPAPAGLPESGTR